MCRRQILDGLSAWYSVGRFLSKCWARRKDISYGSAWLRKNYSIDSIKTACLEIIPEYQRCKETKSPRARRDPSTWWRPTSWPGSSNPNRISSRTWTNSKCSYYRLDTWFEGQITYISYCWHEGEHCSGRVGPPWKRRVWEVDVWPPRHLATPGEGWSPGSKVVSQSLVVLIKLVLLNLPMFSTPPERGTYHSIYRSFQPLIHRSFQPLVHRSFKPLMIRLSRHR